MSIELAFDTLTTIVAIVLWCVGLRTITDEGMILYFLRKPFEEFENTETEITEQIHHLNFIQSADAQKEISRYETQLLILKFMKWFAKPIILCVPCFASVWGTMVYFSMHDFAFTWPVIAHWVFCCVAASFWNLKLWKAL